MKRIIFIIIAALSIQAAAAQSRVVFPFQGGAGAMTKFFKDSLKVPYDIIKKKAAGTAVFKFTADANGSIKKIIVYYADDAILIKPAIDVLKRSDRKWIIPDGQKLHDFIIPFNISFNPPASGADIAQKDFYTFYTKRTPIVAFDQVPLDEATLLPAVEVKYNIP